MVTVLLVCLTSYRATRLLAKDSFPPIALARARIAEHFGDHHWISYLTSCSWCTGVYVSAATTLATDIVVGLPTPFLVWPTAAAVTGLLAAWDDGPQ